MKNEFAPSPAALAAFKKMQKLDARCCCKPEDLRSPPCSACNKYWKQHDILEAALGLGGREFPAVEKPGMGPHTKAQQRYRLLEEACEQSPTAKEGDLKPPREADVSPVADSAGEF